MKTIDYNGIELDIDFTDEPGDPGVYTWPNGDPGYPAVPPEFYITKICYNGVDITELIEVLPEAAMETITNELLKNM